MINICNVTVKSVLNLVEQQRLQPFVPLWRARVRGPQAALSRGSRGRWNGGTSYRHLAHSKCIGSGCSTQSPPQSKPASLKACTNSVGMSVTRSL